MSEPTASAAPDGPAAPEPLSLSIDERGIGSLIFPEAAVHLTPELVRAIDGALGAAEDAHTAGTLRAVVISSRRGNPFLLGEGLEELLAVPDPSAGERLAMAGQRTLRRLEQLPVPTIAAVEGGCLGAGLELALACSYRIASTTPAARFGLPQVRMGMIPGLGATVRLPRLIGLQDSIRLVLTGESIGSAEAREIGLVDSVVPAASFEAGVRAFALERIERGRVRTGARRPMARRVFEDTAPGRRLLFSRAARGLIPSLPFPRPALQRALQSIAEGISLPLDRAFQHEAELYGELVSSEETRSLLHLALLTGDRPKEARGATVRRVAVLGAGSRGAELAHLFASAGIPVRLKDRKRGAMTAGVQAVRERLALRGPSSGSARGGVDPAEKLVSGASGFGGFGTDDLVLAAVGDRPQDARLALVESERHSSESCLLATTSPFVRVGEVQSALRSPSRSLGLVFTSPVELFPVMEIVPGPGTDPAAVATARHLARRLGCIPVVVSDRPGLLVHRLLAVQLAEATRLVDEGVGVEQIDAALEEFGMRIGPLLRIDALGAERVASLFERLGSELGDRASPGAVLGWLRERGSRFYRYRGGRVTGANPEIAGRFPKASNVDVAAAVERVLLSVLNEAALVLEEGGAEDAGGVDLAAVHGLGYPATRGGPLYQADRAGLVTVVARMEALAELHGERFAPGTSLRKAADAGETLYPSAGRAGQVGEAALR